MDTRLLQDIVSAKRCGRHSWREIAAHVGLDRDQARTKYINWQRFHAGGAHGGAPVPGLCPICQPGRCSFKEQGNYAEATVVSEDVSGVDELLHFLEEKGQDLSEWRVKDWEIKVWSQGANIKTGHLEWEDSHMNGHLDYEGLKKQDLRSVWVRFVRKNPIPIAPVIQPVEVAVPFAAPVLLAGGQATKTLVVVDAHVGFRKQVHDARLIPFHDRRILDLVQQVAALEQPDRVLLVGDTADLADWSDKFVREPDFYFTTQPMILELHWRLAQLRQTLPEAEIVMHQGNHSARMPLAILGHLVAAYGLHAADELSLPAQLSLPRLLALHQLGIRWVGDYPSGEYWLTDNIRAMHGNKSSTEPGATAKKMLKAGISTIYGHDHTKALLWDTLSTREGSKAIFAYNAGCACCIDGRVPGHTPDQNWHQGFGLLEEQEGLVTVTDVKVEDGRAVWRGKVLEGCDDVGELKACFPDWNW